MMRVPAAIGSPANTPRPWIPDGRTSSRISSSRPRRRRGIERGLYRLDRGPATGQHGVRLRFSFQHLTRRDHMSHAYQTDQYEGMIAETVSMKGHNGDSILAYVARPLGSGPFPGM